MTKFYQKYYSETLSANASAICQLSINFGAISLQRSIFEMHMHRNAVRNKAKDATTDDMPVCAFDIRPTVPPTWFHIVTSHIVVYTVHAVHNGMWMMCT